MTSEKTQSPKHAPKSEATRAKMSAAARGNKHAAKPPESRRVVLATSVSRETLRLVDAIAARAGWSRGKVIDAAVEALERDLPF